MLDQSVLDRFVESCPAAVMIRATLENLLPPERLDQIFEDHRARQYQQDVFFSDLVALMSAVATRTHASVHKSYLASQRKLNVSPEAVYAKLRRLEPDVTAGLIRETAVDAAGAIDAMPGARKMVLEGFEVFFLDGNHLAGSEHRIAELRHTREGALPGQTLALLDAQRELVTELVPGEDGHAQERSLLPELLRRIRAQTVLVADRNFCTTKFLFGLRRAGAFFIIRQHASTLNWETLGKRERIGRVATGVAYEREVALREGTKADAEVMRARRITIELDETTEDGETAIHVLTNLTPEQADARRIAEAYRARWTIEGVFQKLTDVLRCEVRTLGYPKAALFSFAMAVLAWNVYAVAKAALRAARGQERIEETFSDDHFITHVVSIKVGMDIAVEPRAWDRYRPLSPAGLGRELMSLARRVNLSRYPKKKRGPKKPRPKRKSGRRNHHLSTARLLAETRRH